MSNPRRGDVYLVSLDPTQGQEIKKVRPCAIVSPNELNDHLSTFMVAPMMTGGHGLTIRAAGNAPRTGSETAIISTNRCPATAILAIAAQGAALPDKCMPPLIVPIQTEKIWNP